MTAILLWQAELPPLPPIWAEAGYKAVGVSVQGDVEASRAITEVAQQIAEKKILQVQLDNGQILFVHEKSD